MLLDYNSFDMLIYYLLFNIEFDFHLIYVCLSLNIRYVGKQIVRRTLYCVHCTAYTVLRTLYGVHCAPYSEARLRTWVFPSRVSGNLSRVLSWVSNFCPLTLMITLLQPWTVQSCSSLSLFSCSSLPRDPETSSYLLQPRRRRRRWWWWVMEYIM